MTAGRKQGILCGLMSAASAFALSATAQAAPVNYGGLVWDTDRYAPDVVQVGTFNGRSNALRIAFGPNGEAEVRGGLNGSFWQYQGIQAPTGLPGRVKAFYETDMWVPASWAVNIPSGSNQDPNPPNNYLATIINGGTNTHYDASLWAEIPSNAAPGLGAYPTWGMLNDTNYSGSTRDAYLFDGDSGNLTQRGAGTVNYGAWNTLRMEYLDTELRVYVNGTLALTHVWSVPDITFAGDPNNTFKTLFLNHFNYETAGANNYNNFSAALADYWNFYYSRLNFGIIVDTARTQSANLNGSVEVVSGGVMTVGNGIVLNNNTDPTSVQGVTVKNGGSIKGGTVANPYVVKGFGAVLSGGTFGGNATINGNFTNNAGGVISPGNSPGVFSVLGNYAGGGSILAEVQFNNVNAPVNGTTHDFVNITGNVTGVTSINVTPFAPSGSPVATTGNGVELVRVGGTTTAGSFVLSGPVIQGGFQYLLAYLPNYSGALDGYFLQSALQQELALGAAVSAAGKGSLSACSRDSGAFPDMGGAKGRAWAGGQYGSFNAAAETGLAFDSSHHCYGGGLDAAAGDNWFIGLSGGFGSTDADVALTQGTATLDGDSTMLEGRVSYVSGSMFATGTVGYSTTDWTVVKAGGGALGATVDGLVGSLRMGHRSGLGSTLSLTLSAALDYDGTSCQTGCLLAGSSLDTTDLSGELAARIDGSFAGGRIMPYAMVSLSDDFGDGTTSSFGNAVSTSDSMSMLMNAEVGVLGNVWSNVSVFAKGGITEGLDSDSDGMKAAAGAVVSW